MTSYVNTEKNPADVLTKNVVEKNEQAWICDPKWDDGLLEQGECESELIYIVMTNIQMSRLWCTKLSSTTCYYSDYNEPDNISYSEDQ